MRKSNAKNRQRPGMADCNQPPHQQLVQMPNLERLRAAFEIFNQQNAALAILSAAETAAENKLKLKQDEFQRAVTTAPSFIPTHLQNEVTALRNELVTIADRRSKLAQVAFETVRQVYNENCAEHDKRI